MGCYCRAGKVHFVDSALNKRLRRDSMVGVCGRRFQVGEWTDEDRICKNPYWGSGKICKSCIKWLKENRPDILEMWDQAKELKDVHFARLREHPQTAQSYAPPG